MNSLMNKFRKTLVVIAAAGTLFPAPVWAHSGPSHNSGSSSASVHNNSSSRVIAAANGNTGFRGLGLPKPLDTGKFFKKDNHDSSNIKLGGGVVLPNNVTSAANGNTGFTGLGLPQGGTKTAGSFTATSSLGVFAATTSVAGQKAINSGIIVVGGKNAALNSTFKPGDAVSLNPQPLPPKVSSATIVNFGDAVSLNPQPLPPKVALAGKFSSSSAALLNQTRSGFSGGDSAGTRFNSSVVGRQIDLSKTGPLPRNFAHPDDHSKLGASVVPSALPELLNQSQERTQHSTDTGDSQGNRRDNQMITKLQANATYVQPSVHFPSFPVTKVKVDSTANVKQLVDQKVQIGPKLPGPLSAAEVNTPVAVLAKNALPNTQDMHTMMFGLPIPDPTGGIATGLVEGAEAILGGGGDGAAAAGAATSGGAVGGAAGASIFGNGGPIILGGLPGSPMEVAKAAGAASASAAQAAAAAAQSAAGGAVIAGSAGIVTAIPFLATDPIGVLNSLDYYETGQGGSLGDPGIGGRNRPGGYYQGDAPSKQADGPVGQKKQFLTSSQSKLSSLATASPFKLLGKPTSKNDSSSTQNQPGGSNADSNASGTSSTATSSTSAPSSKSTRGSRLGSLLSNLSSSLGSGSGDSTGDTSGGGSTNSAPASTTPASSTDSVATSNGPEITPVSTTVSTSADLVLEDVKPAAPATLVAGPAYTITFRNQGTEAAGKFQVAVLAGLDGKLTDDAPRAVVEVKSLAAGEAKEVTLRLPQSALKLTGVDGKPTFFTHLFIAVDLMNTVMETDETNNTAVLERATLETTAVN